MTTHLPTTLLLTDVRELISSARQRVASVVNAELTRLYWQIGRRINQEVLQGQRAEVFPDEQVLSTVQRELTWSHLKSLIYIGDSIKRDFYIEICRIEHWSVRQLQERINSMLFERPPLRHCEERSDAAIQNPGSPRACGPRDDEPSRTSR